MEWLIENWTLLVVALAAVVCSVVYVKKFADKPTEDQIKAAKEWLVYAVTLAEKELGGGTGKLKLRLTYEWFIEKFPWVAKCVSFETFSVWVDEALLTARKLLEENQAIKGFVNG